MLLLLLLLLLLIYRYRCWVQGLVSFYRWKKHLWAQHHHRWSSIGAIVIVAVGGGLLPFFGHFDRTLRVLKSTILLLRTANSSSISRLFCVSDDCRVMLFPRRIEFERRAGRAQRTMMFLWLVSIAKSGFFVFFLQLRLWSRSELAGGDARRFDFRLFSIIQRLLARTQRRKWHRSTLTHHSGHVLRYCFMGEWRGVG